MANVFWWQWMIFGRHGSSYFEKKDYGGLGEVGKKRSCTLKIE